jgi:hypothetical protein
MPTVSCIQLRSTGPSVNEGTDHRLVEVSLGRVEDTLIGDFLTTWPTGDKDGKSVELRDASLDHSSTELVVLGAEADNGDHIFADEFTAEAC